MGILSRFFDNGNQSNKSLECHPGLKDFDLVLYRQMAPHDQNYFFSPFSINIALSMVLGGARANSAKQIASAMNINDLDKHHQNILDNCLSIFESQDENLQFHLANALFPAENFSFSEHYQAFLRHYYNSEIKALNYKSASEHARSVINNWVEEQTNSKIKNLISEGILSADTVMVLVNAIYFKGVWDKEFWPDMTKQEDFFPNNLNPVQTAMMHMTDDFRYSENDHCQCLEMPYLGRAISMITLLPKERDGLYDLETKLSANFLNELLNQLDYHEVIISYPKFKIDSHSELKDKLIDLGICDIFNREQSDLSGMDGSDNLFIDAILHKAFIDLNEQGTEAAAATAIAMEALCMPPEEEPPPPKIFKADHPFIYLILDKKQSTILFMGKLCDPSN